MAVNVCIVGVGLVGGSLGMALRRVKTGGRRKYKVVGHGRSASMLKKARRLGALDAYSTRAADAVAKADVVVLCVPVQAMRSVTRKISLYMKRGALLTDVGSVKSEPAAQIASALARRRDVAFVGGHPLAGSEKSGVENADAGMFRGAVCVITPGRAPQPAVKTVTRMWTSVGARVIPLAARKHDQILALTSHLPHLLAFSLFSVVRAAARKDPAVGRLAASSFKDMTRIAGSDPDLWSGVLAMNRGEIRRARGAFAKALFQLTAVPDRHIRETLSRISRAKRSW